MLTAAVKFSGNKRKGGIALPSSDVPKVLDFSAKLAGVESELATADARRHAAYAKHLERVKLLRVYAETRAINGIRDETILSQVLDAGLVAEIRLLELGAK